MNFAEMIAVVISIEGGLSMDPDDPGNWTGGAKGSGQLKGTKFGISAARFPDLDICSLTRSQAIEIYRVEYFEEPKVSKLPEALQLLVLDAIIHHGPGSKMLADDGAIRFLQRALGVNDDGVIGPETLRAAESADPLLTQARMLGERLHFMTYCKTWSLNSRGFARRVARHLKELRA